MKMPVKYNLLSSRYKVLYTRGKGTFAKVKVGVHCLTAQTVALKIMDKNDSKYDLVRVEREIKSLKSLHHPNIVRLFEVLEDKDYMVLVLEYCAGGELFDYIGEKKSLSTTMAQTYMRQIVAAIGYSHSKGIIHRDLKPENILLNSDGDIKIIDFGLCSDPSSGISQLQNTFCGSPSYAAPELIQQQRYYGPAVDVWSLGVITYTVLTGKLPFDSNKLSELYEQIKTGQFQPSSKLKPHDIQLLKQMLAVDPTVRIGMNQLSQHEWFRTLDTSIILFESPYDMVETQIDKHLITVMSRKLKLSEKKVRKYLDPLEYDEYCCMYLILNEKQKRVRCGILGSNDLGSSPVLDGCNKQQVTATPRRRRSSMGEDNIRSHFVKPKARGRCSKNKSPMDNRLAGGTDISFSLDTGLEKLHNAENDEETLWHYVPGTPTNKGIPPPSPGGSHKSNILGSIGRSLNKLKNIFTPLPREDSGDDIPILDDEMHADVSSVSCDDPKHLLEQLITALKENGIPYKINGYRVKGRIFEYSGKVKLSFQLQIIRTKYEALPYGIRRIRMHGCVWEYKKIITLVLNIASMYVPGVPLHNVSIVCGGYDGSEGGDYKDSGNANDIYDVRFDDIPGCA